MSWPIPASDANKILGSSTLVRSTLICYAKERADWSAMFRHSAVLRRGVLLGEPDGHSDDDNHDTGPG